MRPLYRRRGGAPPPAGGFPGRSALPGAGKRHGKAAGQSGRLGFGSVARGVCEIGGDGKLVSLTERLKIEKRDGAAAFTEDDGATYTPLALDTLVSMNLFGLQRSVLDAFEARFPAFLDENLPKNPMKCEYLLPRVLDAMMREGKISIKVLETTARWHGITNRPDLPILKEAIRRMKDEGQYPEELWK